MPIGEPHPLRSQAVEVGRGNPTAFGIVAGNIPIPKIVGVNHHDVGLGTWSLLRLTRHQGDQHEQDQGTDE